MVFICTTLEIHLITENVPEWFKQWVLVLQFPQTTVKLIPWLFWTTVCFFLNSCPQAGVSGHWKQRQTDFKKGFFLSTRHSHTKRWWSLYPDVCTVRIASNLAAHLHDNKDIFYVCVHTVCVIISVEYNNTYTYTYIHNKNSLKFSMNSTTF